MMKFIPRSSLECEKVSWNECFVMFLRHEAHIKFSLCGVIFSIKNTNTHYMFWIHCFKNSSSAWSRMRGSGVHGLYRSPGNTSLTRCRLLSLCVYPFLPFTALNKLMDPERQGFHVPRDFNWWNGWAWPMLTLAITITSRPHPIIASGLNFSHD